MSWKEWPSWTKGGIIFAGIIFILFIIANMPIISNKSGELIEYYYPNGTPDYQIDYKEISTSIYDSYDLVKYLFIGLFPAGIIMSLVFPECFIIVYTAPDYCYPANIYITAIFNVALYFLIGALIGWIVGKVKSKDNSISQDNTGTN